MLESCGVHVNLSFVVNLYTDCAHLYNENPPLLLIKSVIALSICNSD
jgi:hypothetical protein